MGGFRYTAKDLPADFSQMITEFSYLDENKIKDIIQDKKFTQMLALIKDTQAIQEKTPSPKKISLTERLAKKIIPPNQLLNKKIVDMKNFNPGAINKNLGETKSALLQDKKYVADQSLPPSPGVKTENKIADQVHNSQPIPNSGSGAVVPGGWADKSYPGKITNAQLSFKVEGYAGKGEAGEGIKLPTEMIKDKGSNKVTASLEKENIVAKDDFSSLVTAVNKVSNLTKKNKTTFETNSRGGSEVNIRTYGQISARKIIASPLPPYPVWAEERGLEGMVSLLVIVRPNGPIKDIIIEQTSGYSAFDQSAIQSLRKWLFNSIEGKEEQQGIVTFIFRIGG